MANSVWVRSGTSDLQLIGERERYGDALTLALDTLRVLEELPPENQVQRVEIKRGNELLFAAEVSMRRSDA